MNGSPLKLRTAQRRYLRLTRERRLSAFLARRQFGKTTTFAAIALRKMMKLRNHTVIFGSAKIELSREIVRKESDIINTAVRDLAGRANTHLLETVDAGTGRAIPDAISADDLAEIYESQRLEFRLYHDTTSYSRTKVVALRPDTVGETGDLMCDEIGRIRNWRDVWEAVEPIVAANPDYRLTLATTPPPDDGHFSFEMLAPPIDADFKPAPEGNLYTSEMGIAVLRVDAWDAYADGIPVYDLNTGQPLAPEESRARAHDRDAWDRNYGCKFLLGGTSACGLQELDVAQRRGLERGCRLIQIETDSDFDRALLWIVENIRPDAGDLGLGWDLATTEKGTSNPSAFALAQAAGPDIIVPAVLVWKTADDALALERARRIVQTLARHVRRARRLAIDSTNERYFANSVRRALAAELPVSLVVASETVTLPGEGTMTYKQYLNGRVIAVLEDNRFTLPPERYLRDDWRLVKRSRGSYDTEISPSGQHGDTFDAVKLAYYAARSPGGPVSAAPVATGGLEPIPGASELLAATTAPGIYY